MRTMHGSPAPAPRGLGTASLGLLRAICAFTALALLWGAAASGEAAAQTHSAASVSPPPEWDGAREQLTRTELEEMLEQLAEHARSSAYSARMRADARQTMEVIRTRLAEGDFQIGDRIFLQVQHQGAMSDTLVVRPGRVIDVPGAGELELDGVLRSELQEVMEEHINKYLRNPVVRTETLIRLWVEGAVGRPGFYVFPAHTPITDALMAVGGPGANARLDAMRVERSGTRIWDGEAMERAIIQGRTLDQMSIRAGDRIVVPIRPQRDGWQRARLVIGVVSSVLAFGFTASRIF